MPVNNKPIFAGIPNVVSTRIQSGTPVINLSSLTKNTNIFNIFSANATYGSYVQKIRVKVTGGTYFTENSSATVLKFLISETSAINAYAGAGRYGSLTFFDELSLPAFTFTKTLLTPNFEIPVNLQLGPGSCIWVGWSADAGVAIDVTVIAGDYNQV